jgi:hypothetical protein
MGHVMSTQHQVAAMAKLRETLAQAGGGNLLDRLRATKAKRPPVDLGYLDYMAERVATSVS